MEAKIRLTLDGRDYNAKIAIAENDLKHLKKESDSVRDSMAGWGMAITGFQSALQLVAGQLSQIIQRPIAEAGRMEQYSVALKVMLGDAEKAQERLAELVKFAAETPFELPQVVEAGNKLQALGRYSIETLTMLGDLASASGKPFEQALSAFSKMASGQKGMAIDMFRDLLITTDDWAEKTGKAIDKQGQFKGSVEEMMIALPKIVKDKGFAGMMEEQSKTVLGKLSNLQDSIGQTAAKIGESMLPMTKDLLDNVIPALDVFRNNLGTIGPVIGGLTASVLLYSSALRIQALTENLSMNSLRNNMFVRIAQNVQTRIATSIQTLQTSATLAYGIVVDLLTRKINVATASTELLRLAQMSLGAILTLAGAGIGAVTVAWSLYEMTVAQSRKEMIEAYKESERLKTGLDKLNDTLKVMSFDQMNESIEESKKQIKGLNDNILELQRNTPTGVKWLDNVITRGDSDLWNDLIALSEADIELRNERIKKIEAYKKAVTEAQAFTKSFNDESFKGLTSILKVQDARNKITLAQEREENVLEQARLRNILQRLDIQEQEIRSGTLKTDADKKTHEQIVTNRLKYYDTLTQLDRNQLGNYKKYLEEQLFYYNDTLKKQKGGFENFSAEQLATLLKLKEELKKINEQTAMHPSFTLPSGLAKGERETKRAEQEQAFKNEEKIAQLRIDAIRDSLQRQSAEIEKWYAEERESDLYRTSQEAKLLIDQQYYNKKADLRKAEFEKEREGVQAILDVNRSLFTAITDLEMSGVEKREAIIREFYRIAINLLEQYLERYITAKLLEASINETVGQDSANSLKEGAEQLAITTGLIATQVVASQTAIAEMTASVIASMEAITASASTAATLTAIATFGGSALAGSASVLVALATIKAITSGSTLGYAKGGAIIGENGPEIVAPIDSYVEGNRQLVTQTILAVKESVAKLELERAQLNERTDKEVMTQSINKFLEQIDKWQRELRFKVSGFDLKTVTDKTQDFYNRYESKRAD